MESKIARAVRLRHEPAALFLSDERPAGPLQFQEGRWGCLMWLLAAAAEGKTAVCGEKTFGGDWSSHEQSSASWISRPGSS